MLAIALVMTLTAPPVEARFVVRTTDGQESAATNISISANGDVSMGQRSLKPGEWFSFQRDGTPRPDWPGEAQAILVNGDRVAGAFLKGDAKSATLKATFGSTSAEVAIPFSALDALWLAAPPAETPAFPDRYAWLKDARKSDVVLLGNGEALRGDAEGFNDKNELKLKIGETTREIPAAVIQAVAFNPALTVRKAASGTRFAIVATSGMRLTAKQLTEDAKGLALTTSFGASMTLPWSDVVAVTRWSADVLPLGDLKCECKSEPFGDVAWPSQINRSVKQKPLRLKTALGSETFDSGVGTHPRATLQYDLAAKYRVFEATVGYDAVTGRGGSASLKILVDGKARELSALAPLPRSDDPRVLRVDVAGAKTLTLRIDFGPGGDVQADVNWIDARLLK